MKKLLYFSAGWCGPCQQLSPIMEELQSEGITVQKIDVDSNPEICQAFNVKNVPTVVFTVNDLDKGRKVGLNPKQAYTELYNQD